MYNKMDEKVKKFVEYYRIQEIGERQRIRDEFLERSGLRYSSWYARLRKKNFSALEMAALSDICGRDF